MQVRNDRPPDPLEIRTPKPRPNDEQRSGLLVLPEILEGVRVKVSAGTFAPANLRLLESVGVIVEIKHVNSCRVEGPFYG